MGSEYPPFDKAKLEKTWANYAARHNLRDAERALWNSFQYTLRPYVYYDKILIAWTVVKGEPQVKDVFTVVSIETSFQDGIWLHMRSKVNSHAADHLMTHTPRMLPGLNIFGWVPFFNELRFTSARWEDPTLPKNLRLAVCFKMRNAPGKLLTENEEYISELHVFRDRFPQYASTRF